MELIIIAAVVIVGVIWFANRKSVTESVTVEVKEVPPVVTEIAKAAEVVVETKPAAKKAPAKKPAAKKPVAKKAPAKKAPAKK